MAQKRLCARESCTRGVRPTTHRFCSPLCALLTEEWDFLERQPGLDTEAGTAAWVALAAAGDAWTAYLVARTALRKENAR